MRKVRVEASYSYIQQQPANEQKVKIIRRLPTEMDTFQLKRVLEAEEDTENVI